jgi:hypothetical protein
LDLNTTIVLLIVLILAMNQAVMRIPRYGRDERVFWSVQFFDLAMASIVLFYGIPGLEAYPAVPVVVSLLFVMHVAQNHNMRANWQAELRSEEGDAIRAEAERLRATRDPEEDF